ncbi:MAG: SURF1 family protein [Dokdonella sp.]|nr:SURF1 family protein [Dokdonella sp.]
MSARRWHAPRWYSVLLTLFGIAVFFALGAWQVRRAHEKEALFAAFDAAPRQAPITLAQARKQASAQVYPLVEVTGSFDSTHAYLLDDQVRGGKVGVMRWDVFEPSAGGPALLVNRGFVPRDARGGLPTLPSPPAGVIHLQGLYAPPPGAGLRLGGNALPRQAQWPKTTIYIDLGEIGADLGRGLDARVLLETDAADAGAGFVRQWRPEVFPTERHYGYAFTWFAFCGVVVATFLVLHWRRKSDRP